MELNYDVKVKASLDDTRKTGIIEGQAIDSSVNQNFWQVPEEDIDYFLHPLLKIVLLIHNFFNLN